MTKILVEHSFHHPYNPTVVTGGAERYCQQLYELLQLAYSGVKLYVSADTEDRFITSDTVRSPRLSKQYYLDRDGKFFNHKKWWLELDAVSPDFDLVVTNSELSTQCYNQLSFLPERQSHINHFAFLCRRAQMSFRYMCAIQIIRAAGGNALVCGNVPMASADYWWSYKFDVIKKAYGHLEPLAGWAKPPLHSGLIDVNILPSDRTELMESSGKKVLFVGRPEKGKRAGLAAKVLVDLSTRGYDCEMFITPYGADYLSVIETVKGSLVKLNVGAPHDQIMEAYSSSDLLFFPSRDEASGGLTAFEAASSGCRVLYTIPEPDYFLKGHGGVFTEERTVNNLVDEVITTLATPHSREDQKAYYENHYSDDAVLKRTIDTLM